MNLIEFANPAGWWWAFIALPIIAFHMLRVRVKRQPVSTLLFWDRLFDEKKPRAWWQQLRHWLSLLLQLAFLSLLIGALVDPLWSWQKNQSRKVILIIDNSASMAVIDTDSSRSTGPSRFEQAKRAAASLVRALRPNDELAVITAGGRAQVAIGLTDHARSLLDAINRIEKTDTPNALTAAVNLAKRLIPDSSTSSSIVLLTDGNDPALEELAADNSLTIQNFGKPTDNLAITQFQVRRSLLDAISYQVLVEVSNFSSSAIACRLELNLEDSLVDVIPLEIEPGTSKTLNLDHASASGGQLVATLNHNDALDADNRALAILPQLNRIPISVASPGSIFLTGVLASIPLVEVTNESPTPNSIAVFHRDIPQQLPTGKLLIVNPRNDCDAWTIGQPIETPLASVIAQSSPITQHVRLDNVLFPGALELNFKDGAETLIQTPLEQPLLSLIHRPNGDVLVLNVDLDLGDLPLRIAFPVLMKNAVEWLHGNQGVLQPAFATGQPVTIQLPQTLNQPSPQQPSQSNSTAELEIVQPDREQTATHTFSLRSPAGNETPLASDSTTATIPMLDHCGTWTITTKQSAEPMMQLACNLCNRDESDLRSRSAADSKVDDAWQNIASQFLGGRPIWFYLVLASIVFTAVEWWLYQRRVVG